MERRRERSFKKKGLVVRSVAIGPVGMKKGHKHPGIPKQQGMKKGHKHPRNHKTYGIIKSHWHPRISYVHVITVHKKKNILDGRYSL